MSRRPALVHHALRRGRDRCATGSRRETPAPGGRRAPHRAARPPPRSTTPTARRGPSRHQAREHPAHQDGHALVADFGIARALRRGRRRQLTETGIARRHAGLHEPRAGERATRRRRADRHLLARLRALRDARRASRRSPAPPRRRSSPSGSPSRRRACGGARHRARGGRRRRSSGRSRRSPADRFATAAEFARALAGRPTAGGAAADRAGRGAGRRRAPRPPAPARDAGAAATRAARARARLRASAWACCSPGAAPATARGRGRRSRRARRAPVRESRRLGRRLLRRRDHRRGARQAGRDSPGLQVIARGSSTSTGRARKRPQQIGRELGVRLPADRHRALGEGDGRRQPGAGDARSWWRSAGHAPRPGRQPFDAALTDVFQVQADIAGRSRGARRGARRQRPARAGGQAHREPGRLRRVPEGRGRLAGHGHPGPAEPRRAIDFYERAVALDSTFVPAWAQLARAHALLYRERPHPRDGRAGPGCGRAGSQVGSNQASGFRPWATTRRT